VYERVSKNDDEDDLGMEGAEVGDIPFRSENDAQVVLGSVRGSVGQHTLLPRFGAPPNELALD